VIQHPLDIADVWKTSYSACGHDAPIRAVHSGLPRWTIPCPTSASLVLLK
jgi:hypothetical protein